jgi:hypothetical protein
MSLTELLSSVRSLTHQDKLRLLQFLAGELSREEDALEITPGAHYPVYTPYGCFEAAEAMRRVLESDDKS